MAVCVCSSPKKEGELPDAWFNSEKEAWEAFNNKIYHSPRKKMKWIVKPELIVHDNKFNVIGWRE